MNTSKKHCLLVSRFTVTLAAILLLLAGCSMPLQPKPRPVSYASPTTFSFGYECPSVAKEKCGVTMAFVRPQYDVKSTNPQWVIGETDKAVLDSFVKSLESDIEKIVIAKGVNITGPFERLDDMTFPQKKTADLTLTPVVNLTMSTQDTRSDLDVSFMYETKRIRHSTLSLSGWASLVILEPLSGEKMWQKKIDLQPVTKPYVVAWGENSRQIVENTSMEAEVEALMEIYKPIVERVWTYLNVEEIVHLKKQAEQLRQLKRY